MRLEIGKTHLIHRPDQSEVILTETAEIDQDPQTETSGTSEKQKQGSEHQCHCQRVFSPVPDKSRMAPSSV